MVYGVFDGEYSDWGVRGYFTTLEEAEKYCAIHTDCYIEEMSNLEKEEDLSEVELYYEYGVVFDKTDAGYKMRPKTYYEFYQNTTGLKNNKVTWNPERWIDFQINSTRRDDEARCEKIAQDCLARLLGDKGYITEEDINAMNEWFNKVDF